MANTSPLFSQSIQYNCQVKTTAMTWLDKALTPNMALTQYRYETLPKDAGLGNILLFFKDPGLNIVSHETPSTLMILEKKSSKLCFQTNKFLLQSITKPQQEKFQVIETFGKPHLYFYGERTRVYTIQGVLLDAYFDNEPMSDADASYRNMWTLGFQTFYDNELRGTRLIEKQPEQIAALYVNGWLIKGYPISLTIMKEANQLPDATTFQMTWVIDDELLLNANRTKQSYSINKGSQQYVDLLNQKATKLAEYQIQYNIVNSAQAAVTVDAAGSTGVEGQQYLPGGMDVDGYNAAQAQMGSLLADIKELDRQLTALLLTYGGPKARKVLNMD